MSTGAWELVFLMFVMKLPIAYLIGVVVWAIRANPEPELAALAPARLEPEPGPCPWHVTRRRPPHPSGPRRRVATAGVGR